MPARDDEALQRLIDKKFQEIVGTAGTTISLGGLRRIVNDCVDELHGMSLCVGKGLMVYGDHDAISRAQDYVILDTTHPIEKEDVRRQFARTLQMIERAQGAAVGIASAPQRKTS